MKSALIIGASSSLGKSVVKNFIDSEYKVLASYADNKLNLQKSERVFPVNLDLTSYDSITNFNSIISKDDWAFDVCIFLAGFLPGKNIEDYKEDEIDKVLAINFSGFSKVYTYIQPKLKDNSQVIIVSSISAQRGSYDPIYAASKGALISFMKSLSQSKPLKIRANAIAPGLIEDTSMYDDMDKSRQTLHVGQTPTGKLTKKEDLARIILDITKPHWKNMNGAVVQVNGGSYV